MQGSKEFLLGDSILYHGMWLCVESIVSPQQVGPAVITRVVLCVVSTCIHTYKLLLVLMLL